MIEIRPTDASAEGLETVAALLRRRFPRAGHLSAAYLAWTYRQNPEGHALAFDAWDGPMLVAHFAATPMRARIEGSDERGLLTQHAATEPGFEGRGLFKALVERALVEGAAQGFGHAIALANASSRFAFVERLGFQPMRPLDVRIGVGAGPEPRRRSEASWERVWEPRTLAWRLARPDRPYRAAVRNRRARILCASGYPGILADLGAHAADALPGGLPPPRRAAPLRVWIGLDPDLDWSGRAYAPLPPALRPAPLHFIFRDLRSAGRSPDRARLRVAALDFDAY
jgi:GNAT superfamily N-acetyltransferase